MQEGTIWRIISCICFLFVIGIIIASCPPLYQKQNIFTNWINLNFLSFLYMLVAIVAGIFGFYFKNGIVVRIGIICGFTGFILLL